MPTEIGTDGGFPWRGTRRDYCLGRGPHEFIEDQVARTPNAPALIVGGDRISYSELNARANRMARFLREQGVEAESVVGVCLDRSFDSVISLLAILKSGGTYLPLDPKFPKDRLAFMLADSEVPIVLTHSSDRERLPETTARVILLDRESEQLSKFQSTNLSV
ncbi:MAG: AMP-binding protein, partial [Terriglobales bacterium]